MKIVKRGGLFLPNDYQLVTGPIVSDTLSTTNSELIEEFLEWKKSYTKWAYERYRIWVTRFQEFVGKPPEKLQAADYVSFADSIKDSYAPKCVQYALNIVHNYLRFFAEQGRLGFSLFFVRVPKARSEAYYSITEDEYDQLIAHLKQTKGLLARRSEVICRLLHDTGMRAGELVNLNISDMNTDRSACIPTEKTIYDRHVFWTKETDRALRKLIKDWAEAHPVPKDIDSSEIPLFQNSLKAGSRLTQRTIQRDLKEACQIIGLNEKICLHSFRHGFIHRMVRKGVSDSVTANLVGHSSPLTISAYTRLIKKEQRMFVECEHISEILRG